MKEIDQQNLDTAIALGDAVCKELGFCCTERGRIIFKIFKKLEELKTAKPVTFEISGNRDSTRAEG
jgi:hypothetical protein